MTAPSTSPAVCPSCASVASGRFCASCGTPLDGAACGACRTPLTPGAKFCHRCGTAVGAKPAAAGEPRGFQGALPWAVAAIALLALIALVAGQRFGRTPAPATAGAGAPSLGAGSPGPGMAGPAPDISMLSPDERAIRLFNRIMQYHEAGKRDSVQFFAPMAVAAYQAIESPDADQRYDLGRVGEITGALELARAQADTILRANPTHLLGLVLATRAARAAGDETAAREFERRLVAAQEAELRKNLPEYEQHRNDITEALAQARK